MAIKILLKAFPYAGGENITLPVKVEANNVCDGKVSLPYEEMIKIGANPDFFMEGTDYYFTSESFDYFHNMSEDDQVEWM